MYNPAKAMQSTANLLKIPIISPQFPPPSITESVRREARGSPMRKRRRTSLPTFPPRLRPKARQMTIIRRAKAAKFMEMYPCATRATIHKTAVNITNMSQVYRDTSMFPPPRLSGLPCFSPIVCVQSFSIRETNLQVFPVNNLKSS